MVALACPNCKSLLEVDSALRCKSCGRSYPIVDGVPNFLGEADFYWGEIALEEMEKVIDTARQVGFKAALMNVALEHPELAHYLLSYTRVDWLFHCLSSTSTGACLDIGSGWGSLAFPLAKFYKEVWSLEAVWPRIEFQKLVKEQQGAANVNFVRASMLNLPFPDNYFDLVVANGALEWAGTADHSKNAREVQLDLLREVRRVLKPRGCLYIGIESRFGLHFLLGARDHSGLPFTSVLPRKVADLAVRVLRKTGGVYEAGKRTKEEWKDYRTYTYTASGYEKLLRQAGYSHTEIYWTLNYNHPVYGGRIEDPQSLISCLHHRQRHKGGDKERFVERFVSRLALSLPDFLVKSLVSLFSPCFLIYAYPDEKVEPFQSKILRLEDCKSSFRKSSGDSATAKINYFLISGNDLHSVLKFPRFREALPVIEREERLMEQHNGIAIDRHEIDGTTVFKEPYLKAVRCNFSNPSHNYRALRWLIDFQSRTNKGVWNPAEAEREVSGLQRYISQMSLNVETKHRLNQDLDSFLEHLSQVQLEKVSEHGDYSTGNILINSKKIYVIDWEYYKEEGNPLFDLCFFALTNIMEASVQKPPCKKRVYENLTGAGNYSPIMKELLAEFGKEKNIPPEMLFYAMPYVIIRSIERYDPRFGDWNINFERFTELLQVWSDITSANSIFRLSS